MKKKILAIFLIAALLVCCCGCHKATLEGYKLFRSTPMGFSMEYPDFWSKNADNSKQIAAFVAPAEGYSDQYTESVSVQYFTPDFESDNPLDDYVKNYVAQLEGSLKNYRSVSSGEATLGGEPAFRIVYESASDDGKQELRFMQIFCLHEGKIYMVSYIAEFGSFDYFLTDAEKMIGTFAFI